MILAGAICAAAPVRAQVIAIAQSGTADFGIASRPIANIAANDSVNGVPATLGASGNATVAKYGTWTTGIGLTPTTGAVSTTVAVPDGTYSLEYSLCSVASPPVCAQAPVTVKVITPSIVANPQSGRADFGIASLPIANVVAGDTVDGVRAVLGPSGNAVIQQYPANSWPTGCIRSSTSSVI